MSQDPRRAFYFRMREHFAFTPTEDQRHAMIALTQFCWQAQAHELFLLKGFAGTGKTSLIRSLVHSLPAFGRQAVLLAPTGRAAKVMGRYSGQVAFTLHKHIYRLQASGQGLRFVLRENRQRQVIYIVDEASMIHDQFGEKSDSMLSDLLEFVGRGYQCRLILVGDTAQLPPVQSAESPALDPQYLSVHYSLEPRSVLLKMVMRQQENSVLLANATALRELQSLEPYPLPQFQLGPDLIRLEDGYAVEEALNLALSEVGREEMVILVRSNKRAKLYNQQMRQRVLWQEDEISVGDLLMVVKNNYFWLDSGHGAGFIANGDSLELLEIYEFIELYDRRFARVKVRLLDYDDLPDLEVVLQLKSLDYEGASLPWEDQKAFLDLVLEDYQDLPDRRERLLALRKNVYAQALQVKFSYALTAHKAQGGQWQRVFIEHPWRPEAEIDLDYLRWLYTAFTRAKERVYLMAFPDEYFAASKAD